MRTVLKSIYLISGKDPLPYTLTSLQEKHPQKIQAETGILLFSLKTTVAFCDEFIDVYLARNLKPGHQHLDEGEFLDVEAHDIDELCQMIYDGKLQDAKTVSALLAYKNLLNQEKNA